MGVQFLLTVFFADDALLYMRASHRGCINLANILELYCSASGQVINLDKSSILEISSKAESYISVGGRTSDIGGESGGDSSDINGLDVGVVRK